MSSRSLTLKLLRVTVAIKTISVSIIKKSFLLNCIFNFLLNSCLPDDVQRKTALHYAVQEHRLETVKILLGKLLKYYFKTDIC